MSNQLCLLSGRIILEAKRPKGLEAEIHPFFVHPNNQVWGRTVCRHLYHETLHFWQFLGFGYLANLVARDWDRLLAFEKTGRVAPLTPEQRAFTEDRGEAGFSAIELLECCTRYW